jgi:hypothetical protein
MHEGHGRYCESCGADLEGAEAAAVGGDHRSSTDSPSEWELLITCDRGYFDRVDAGDLEFPASVADRTFSLSGHRIVIGREVVAQPDEQAVDLSVSPADAGISRRHALLARQPDGGWTIVDCHSTNGTYLNQCSEPISPDQPVRLENGVQIHIGAWTTLTLNSHPIGSTPLPRHAESSGAGSRPR